MPDWDTAVAALAPDRDTAVAVLLAVLLAPVVAHVAATALPGVGSYAVTTGSMEPAIGSGALVFVHASGDYGVGDVVTFDQDGVTVTHRIVRATDQGYVTRGDANAGVDDWRVTDDEVVGKVVGSVPLYGRLLAFVGTTGGYAAVVLLPVVVLSALELRALWGGD